MSNATLSNAVLESTRISFSYRKIWSTLHFPWATLIFGHLNQHCARKDQRCARNVIFLEQCWFFLEQRWSEGPKISVVQGKLWKSSELRGFGRKIPLLSSINLEQRGFELRGNNFRPRDSVAQGVAVLHLSNYSTIYQCIIMSRVTNYVSKCWEYFYSIGFSVKHNKKESSLRGKNDDQIFGPAK